ncbi:hypothetical protein BJ508DRAFT_341574 [Ascobolus immersus RN42]|uniref:Uncharacterized protein n=1 Tax=Ascobolus immersus RN42 TaxID=1160509 RepID=A0A3N4HNB8_ASCIM|nr:hypothetical protein BJ508DRAFT_341574 [Ascobolus immersus RN42]
MDTWSRRNVLPKTKVFRHNRASTLSEPPPVSASRLSKTLSRQNHHKSPSTKTDAILRQTERQLLMIGSPNPFSLPSDGLISRTRQAEKKTGSRTNATTNHPEGSPTDSSTPNSSISEYSTEMKTPTSQLGYPTSMR